MSLYSPTLEKEFLHLGFADYKEMLADPLNDGGTFLTTKMSIPSPVGQGLEEVHFYFVISYPEDDQSPFIKYIAATRVADIHSFSIKLGNTTQRYWKDKGPLPTKQDIIRDLAPPEIMLHKLDRAKKIAGKGIKARRNAENNQTTRGNSTPGP